MHASLLNEDLIQPGKLEIGISHRTVAAHGISIGARTRQLPDGRQPLPNRVTSEVPVIQEEQPVRASCASFSLLAVDRPTSGWRQA